MPWSFCVQLVAAASAHATRNRWVSASIPASWSVSRSAAPSSSPYTSTWLWSHAPLPTRTGRLPRQPSRCASSRSLRSCSPPTPNMICRPRSGPTEDAAAVVMNAKKSSASSGQAATHRASMVKLESRTQEKR